MTSRITGASIGRQRLGPDSSSAHGAPGSVRDSAGAQVEERLFGRPPPPELPLDDEAAPLLARLDTFRPKLARLAQDDPSDYRLQLADATIAAIDGQGCVFVGRSFLLETAAALPLQVGVLAHEIGHRPRRWKAYRAEEPLSPSGLEDLCRLEETRADYFSGFALAYLKMDVEPLCAYLKRIQMHPHPEYFVASLREKTIAAGFEAGRRRQANLQKFFPELARVTAVASDLGSA